VTLDLNRFATLFGMVMTSAHDGEVVGARNQLQKLLDKNGLDWAGIVRALEQRGKLLEAAQALKSERDELFDQVERLKRRTAPLRSSPWSSVTGAPQTQAKWLLQLSDDGVISLNTFEEDFLPSIADWDGQITEKQRKSFDRILNKVIRDTGRQPP
jgi:hypothetical protein